MKKFWIFCLLCGLAACDADEVTLTDVIMPDHALALHEVGTLDFRFEARDTDPEGTDKTHDNTIIVVQVPAGWVVTAGFLGIIGDDPPSSLAAPPAGRQYIEPWLMARSALPAGLQAEPGMQLVAFKNYISGNYPNWGRLLFIPPSASGGGIQTAARNIKAVYGRMNPDTSAFEPISPAAISNRSFAGVALPIKQPSVDLRWDGRVLNGAGVVKPVTLGVDGSLGFGVPAQENLPNQYGWRLFFSQTPNFGGQRYVLEEMFTDSAGQILYRPAGRYGSDLGSATDWVDVPHPPLQDGYVDVPAHPGHALAVRFESIFQESLHYVYAVPLVTQLEPPTQAIGSEADSVKQALYVTFSGTIHLATGYVAPAGGTEIEAVFSHGAPYSISQSPGASVARQKIQVPAGANSVAYRLNVPKVYVGHFTVNCLANCGRQLLTTYFGGDANETGMLQSATLVYPHEDRANLNLRLLTMDDYDVSLRINEDIEAGLKYGTGYEQGWSTLWRKGGESQTARGDRVLWGYFYADPNDFDWAHPDNPEIFAKIWHDASGRVDINYCHVSGPTFQIYSSYQRDLQASLLHTSNRYAGFSYYPDGRREQGGGSYDVYPALTEIKLPATSRQYEIITSLTLLPGAERVRTLRHDGGSGTTAGGDWVQWGYFYADPAQASWGDAQNPEVFYKYWIDARGMMNLNFCHLAGPDVEINSYAADTSNPAAPVALTATSTSRLSVNQRYGRLDYQLPVRIMYPQGVAAAG
jgi:hypothetical protein